MGGQDKGDTVKNFLKTLADNNRLGILQGVCEKFSTLMGAARGEIDLIITSASVSHLLNDCDSLELMGVFINRGLIRRHSKGWRLPSPNQSTVKAKS